MAVRAYVLVHTQANAARGVRSSLVGQPGVESVDIITGPYDLVVQLRAASVDDVAKLVLNTLHGVSGVTNRATIRSCGN